MAKDATKLAVDRFIASELVRLNKAGQSWRDLGAVYDVSHVHARAVAHETSGAGPALEATWAAKHFGGSVDELRRAAEAWARELGVWETPDAMGSHRWLDDLALHHVRMLPALEMALDAGVPESFLRGFVERHDGVGPGLGAAQWWNLIQGEWAQEEAAPESEAPAHRRLREVAHAETDAGRKVPEDVVAALKERYAEEPEGGWLTAIKREIIAQLGRGERSARAQVRTEREGKARGKAAQAPARRHADGAAARKRSNGAR